MVSGIVQRIKGREQADTFFAGRGGVYEYVYGPVDAAVTPGSTLPNNGVSIVKCSSAAQVLILAPPLPGIEKTIAVTTMSSGHVSIKNTTGVTFDGVNSIWNASTGIANTVSITLVGLSTTQWAFLGVSNSTAQNTFGMGTSS